MRTYEALYIVRPDLKDDEIQAVAQGIESLITNNGGAIVRSEIWGKRKLAYRVKNYTEGCYILLRFQAAPVVLSRLGGHFRISETVIRHLVVYFDEKTLRLEAEQQQRREAEIRASALPHTTDDDADEEGVATKKPGRSSRRDEDDDDEEDEL